MDARRIASEVVDWYCSKLDPLKSHSHNVEAHLKGPVLSVTQRILHSDTAIEKQQQNYSTTEEHEKGAGEEEKKCCVETEASSIETPLLDKTNWGTLQHEKESERLYESLGRRSKARLQAFLAGVELAVPSFSDRSSPPPSPNIPHHHGGIPPRSQQQKSHTHGSRKISHKKTLQRIPEQTPQPKKQQFQSSSPVLTSLNNHGKALLRSVSVDSNNGNRKQPQIQEKGLLVRLELYIRCLCRVRSLQQDCVIAVEPDKAIKARAQMIVNSFISTVGCVRSMTPVLTRLLTSLTKELLAVEFVGEDLFRVIRRIVNEYEHGTSFASLAFLSSPEASAETKLTPLVLKYIRYLQSDWQRHERACELERMLASSLDGDMRRYFKMVEFQSIGHLLEICHQFQTELQNIELAPTSGCAAGSWADLCNDPDAVRQAIRDLQREVITVNGNVLPPVSTRQELINLLSQSLNSRTLTAAEVAANKAAAENGSWPAVIATSVEPPGVVASSSSKENFYHNNDGKENDNDSSWEDNVDHEEPGKNFNSKRNRRASFHLSTVDILTRRLLIAASRTGTGGDAYFIVRDLFGDDDEVEVVPAKVLPHHVRASRVGSIEIQVRLASVTIKCHGSFDIYPKSLVGHCEPLIQLHTTSSETIYLQELRSCDSLSDDGVGRCLEDDGSRSSDGMDNLVLQEKRTNKTGTRILTIRPALYEKVQVWNTPS